MADKKIIAVVGATGAQGKGLVNAILADTSGEFAVRALTRDPSSAKAQELAALGAEVVAADVDDVESLKKAFQGAYGAYCVTFFWDHYSAEKEMANAKNMADAAKAAGVKHVVWSTLEDTRKWVPLEDGRLPTLQGKYKVPHFDGKGASDAFFTQAGVPTTFLLTTFYWDNFIHFGMGPQKGEDGSYGINLPMGSAKLAGIAASDIGAAAFGIFKRQDLIGKTVGIAGDKLPVAEMAKVLERATGKPIRYHEMTPEAFRGLGFPGADDLGNMFQFYRDFEGHFDESRDVSLTKQLNPKTQSFEEWVGANASKIPLE